MSKHILFTNGVLAARYDSQINQVIPAEALEVSDELFWQTINENDGTWSLVKGKIVKVPFPAPSEAELLERAVNAVRNGLQSAIDDKAKALGFSGGNALMLYAGFANAFQTMAQTFATWEASVWVEADAYKVEVIAGTKPMLTPEEAVALMPAYPL